MEKYVRIGDVVSFRNTVEWEIEEIMNFRVYLRTSDGIAVNMLLSNLIYKLKTGWLVNVSKQNRDRIRKWQILKNK